MRGARRAQGFGYRVREDLRGERGPPPGDPRVRYYHSRAVGAQGLAGFLRSEIGGHGGHRRLLEVIYYVLEDDFESWLLNARHLKNVPGRKTDVKDAAWICQLVEHGLWFVPASCLPKRSGSSGTSPATARLKNRGAHQGGPTSGEGAPGCRDKALLRGHPRARCLRKGFCADALVGGTTDPEVLAGLARGRLRSKLPALRDALEGSFSSHHALMVGKILAHVDYLDESIGELSTEVERVIAPFSKEVELLDTIPGVNRRAAETLIA
jgi:transposase